MTLPTREKARRWRDADTDNKIYMAYCDGVLQTREEWAATIDYEAAEKAYSRGETSYTIVNEAVGGDIKHEEWCSLYTNAGGCNCAIGEDNAEGQRQTERERNYWPVGEEER